MEYESFLSSSIWTKDGTQQVLLLRVRVDLVNLNKSILNTTHFSRTRAWPSYADKYHTKDAQSFLLP